jgi:peptidyl-prolyl cis-trans isomerase C
MKKTLFYTLLVSSSVLASSTLAATVATVNGVKIDDKIVKENLSQIPAELLEGRKEEIEKNLISKLVEQEIIKQEAERLKIREMEEYKKQLKLIQDSLATNLLIQKVVTDLVTDEAVKRAYDENKDRLTAPAVKARHILLETEKDAKAAIKQVAKMKKFGDFAELAKKLSKGPSAPRGGDLGWFSPNDMVKEFSDAAFALKEGKFTTKPVKTQFGWHVILVEEKKDAVTPEFDAVKGQIRQQLQEKTVADYLAQLKENAEVKYE